MKKSKDIDYQIIVFSKKFGMRIFRIVILGTEHRNTLHFAQSSIPLYEACRYKCAN